MSEIRILETIIVTANFPDHQVLAGDLGTIVEIYTQPRLAYEVEFVNPDGSTRALLTLSPEQVRRLSPIDVLTTRQLPLGA
ncbi:MAG TPA: DUF4926 domain-containing protein [Anaerolineales bacterium]|nr:DUF4926 domain-containing protein [Anaerolineales bacterium]